VTFFRDHQPLSEEARVATYVLTKRPVTVQAVPFNGDNYAEVQAFTGPGYFMQVRDSRLRPSDVVAEVFNAPHGEWVGVRVGQWIIRGVVGEFYPVDLDVLHGGYQTPEGGWPA
jgi:hypothetical protein